MNLRKTLIKLWKDREKEIINKKKRKERRKEEKDINRDYCKDKDNVKTRNEYFVKQQGCEYKIRL